MQQETPMGKDKDKGKGKDKKEVEFDDTMETAKAIDYVERLLASLKNGTIYVQQGASSVAINPGPVVTLELEAKRKEKKSSLSLKLKWKETDELRPGEPPIPLEIFDHEPAPPDTPPKDDVAALDIGSGGTPSGAD
jgi:amphi-Trp domain-containing protein